MLRMRAGGLHEGGVADYLSNVGLSYLATNFFHEGFDTFLEELAVRRQALCSVGFNGDGEMRHCDGIRLAFDNALLCVACLRAGGDLERGLASWYSTVESLSR